MPRKKTAQDSNDNFDRSRIVHLFAFFVESLSLYTQSIVRQYNCIIRRFIQNLQIADLLDTISDKLEEHLFLKIVLIASALTFAIPIVMFIMFGITSVIITFVGFLFIEGTLLAIGGLCMFLCIVAMTLALSVLGMAVGTSYVLALKITHILNKYETTSRILRVLVSSVRERHVEVMSNTIVEARQD